MALFIFFMIFVVFITNIQAKSILMDKMHYYVNQNRYTMPSSTFHNKFPLESVMGEGVELAMLSCQNDFKWNHWNCAKMDFMRRLTVSLNQIDREDAYVLSIATAAVLYTITKHCSSGMISECVCDSAVSKSGLCSDNPEKAIELYTKYSPQIFGKDFNSLILKHNFKAVSTLLKQSLKRHCGCSPNSSSEEFCLNKLHPFDEIAKSIKLMYDEGLKLTNEFNTKVMWSNIPLESLVYSAASPDYCDVGAVPNWPGMHGRRCLATNDKESENSGSCQQLCYDCGYHIRKKNIVTKENCNCIYTLDLQVQCEPCINVEQQYFCY